MRYVLEGSVRTAGPKIRIVCQLIDAESPSAILSDDTIVERLRGDGIDIARRTVAKYREAMRIPSSVQRRRDKQSMLGTALTSTSPDRSRDTATA